MYITKNRSATKHGKLYLIFFLINIYFARYASGHCCHPCIRHKFRGLGGGLAPTKQLRGCSLDCEGNVVKDNSCAVGSSQVFGENTFMKQLMQNFYYYRHV